MRKLRSELFDLIRVSDTADKYSIQILIKQINVEIDNDSYWEEFEYHFNNTHQNFITRLKKRFPEMTPNDIKFCAYMRLNLSSKEIASILNISIRGMDAARLRLRKRFDLKKETSLTKFIMDF